MPNTGKLIVISGPSGVGKSTIRQEVLKRTDARYSVSATTRAPRPGEVEGRDYYFIDRAKFQRMIDDGELLEHAEVFGNLYGTPAEPVRRAIEAGQKIVLEIDVQGGLQVAAKMPQATFVLILPPSEEELARRLGGRGTESVEAKIRRLVGALPEIEIAKSSGVYKHCIINENLQDAVRKVVEIVNQEICTR